MPDEEPSLDGIASSERVILVAGLPGSGKTTLLSRMSRNGWSIFDDYKRGAPDLVFRNSLVFQDLVGAVRDGHKCVVADIHFCKTEARVEAEGSLREEVPGITLGWRFFDNDPLACEANIRNRNRDCFQSELEYVQQLSPSYRIPQGAIVFPIRRNANPYVTEN